MHSTGVFSDERFSRGELFYKLLEIDGEELLVLHSAQGGIKTLQPRLLRERH